MYMGKNITYQHLSEEQFNHNGTAVEDEQPELLQMHNDEWHLHTYTVLIVDIVDLVDSESLPLVQLLLLECK